jgi:hypothetical protein
VGFLDGPATGQVGRHYLPSYLPYRSYPPIYVGGIPTGFFFLPPFFFFAAFFFVFLAIQPLLSLAGLCDRTTSSPCGVTENCSGLRP